MEKRSGERADRPYNVFVNKAERVWIGDRDSPPRDGPSPKPPPKVGGPSLKAMSVVLVAFAAVLVGVDTLVEPNHGKRSTTPPLPGPTSASPTTTPPEPTPEPSPTRTPPPLPPPTPAPSPPTVSTPPPRPEPKPSPTQSCRQTRQYRLNNKAQIWDVQGQRVGDVASGTLLFRQEPAAGYPEPVDDRYYGTVDAVISGSPTGYVLRRKLVYVGNLEVCE